MANEHEGEQPSPKDAAGKDNTANPLTAANDDGEAAHHPRTSSAQGEHRSFDPSADAPMLGQAADEESSAVITHDHMGPGGDPVEGKR